MRKIVFLLITLISFGSVCCAQNPKPFVKKDKYGIISGQKVLVKPRYENIEALKLDLYAAKLKSKYGIITKDGLVVIPMTYDSIKIFSDNAYLVKQNEKWGLINRFNGVILPIEYSSFEFVNDYLCKIKYEGKIGFINKFGAVVTLPQYDGVDSFTPNAFLIKQNHKQGVMDSFGRVVVPIEYDDFKKIGDSDSYSVKKGEKYGIMSSDWKLVVPANYDKIEDSVIGNKLLLDGKIGFYTADGQLIQPSFTEVLFYQPEFGLAVVKKGDKRGFVTSQGTVVQPVYENMSRFSGNGIAFVEKEGKLMVVNVMGKEMTVQETMSNTPSPQ